MTRRWLMYGISSLGVALIVMTMMLSGCAQMQSMGLSDPLISMLTGQLNVTPDQAQGGVGSILILAKEKLSGMDFNALTNLIPGADSYMKTAKNLGAVTGPVGDKAGLTSSFSSWAWGPIWSVSSPGCCLIFSVKPEVNRPKIYWPPCSGSDAMQVNGARQRPE